MASNLRQRCARAARKAASIRLLVLAFACGLPVPLGSGCDVASMAVVGVLGSRPDFSLQMTHNGDGSVDLDAREAREHERYRWAELWRIEGDQPYGYFELHEVTRDWPVIFYAQPLGYSYRVALVSESEPDDDDETTHSIYARSTPVMARLP